MTSSPTILSVTELNRKIRSLLEYDVGPVQVVGEVSNLTKPASGHFYFTLKDVSAQLRCVYFRNRHHRGLDVSALQNGQQVIAEGQLSLYEARGDYQLIVEQLSEAGQGDLYRQFELLKAKLAALGLFDLARKRALPKFPTAIGVVTSASAAALRDILTTLARRFPLAGVVIYPSDVQGKLAAPQLCKAITRANADKRCDVLILARGGGSIEDLWAFNDEALAQTIFASAIPIVAGIGHETDFTIADFVADLRAATPTAAAEAVTPDQLELRALVQGLQARLTTTITRFIQHQTLLLNHAKQKLASPRLLVAKYWQTVDYLERHLQHACRQLLTQQQHRLHRAMMQVEAHNPRLLCAQTAARIQHLETQLQHHMQNNLNRQKQRFIGQLQTLHAVSPLATLDRGYAIVMQQDKLVVDSQQVQCGSWVNIRLAKGQLKCEVLTITGENEHA